MRTSLDPIAATIGGLLSFLSPCVLALVPGYVAYLGGASVTQGRSRRALILNALIFIAGFSFVFVLLFAVLRALVINLPYGYKNLLTQVGAVIVVLLGLQFLGLFRIPFFYREARFDIAHRLNAGSPVSASLLGMTFALGWTPCVGPILTFILLRASAHDLLGGAGLMLIYCAGLAVPFLLVAVLIGRARPAIRALNRHGRAIESVSGALLIVVGVLLFTGRFADINTWFGPLARYLPSG